MSNFNITPTDVSPEDWRHIAHEQVKDNNSSFFGIGGLVLGMFAASATGFLPIWLIIAAWGFYEGSRRSSETARTQDAIMNNGCVANCLSPDLFREFHAQVGDEEIRQQLAWARDNNLKLTPHAEDLLDSLPPIQNTRLRAIEASVVSGTSRTATLIDHYDPLANSKIDIIGEMSDRINNTIIVGVSGSGKGMLVANAIRAIKDKHPMIKIFLIDPKADTKEAGYFEGVCDVIKAYPCMDAHPSAVAEWAEETFKNYAGYAQEFDRTLLIVDEVTMLGNKLKSAKSTLLVDKLTSYTSGGDSAGRNVWFMMQTPFVSGSALNLSTTSQMTSICLVSEENLGVLDQWKSSKLIKPIPLEGLTALTNNSETGRAIYYGKTGKWYVMPTLENYSGFDRDQREFLPGYDLQDIPRLPKDNYPVSDSKTTDDNLSPQGKLLIEYFNSAAKKEPKSTRDLRQAHKLRSLSENDLLMALLELVKCGQLKFDIEGNYLKFDW